MRLRSFRSRAGRGIAPGVLAGVVGIGCCVGPAVAALLGVTTAAVATDLANDLYSSWGWAFKLAGAVTATGAVVIARRRASRCDVDPGSSLLRYGVVLGGVAVLTYAALYALTTWLGNIATPAVAGPG